MPYKVVEKKDTNDVPRTNFGRRAFSGTKGPLGMERPSDKTLGINPGRKAFIGNRGPHGIEPYIKPLRSQSLKDTLPKKENNQWKRGVYDRGHETNGLYGTNGPGKGEREAVDREQKIQGFDDLSSSGGNASIVYRLKDKDLGVENGDPNAYRAFFKEQNVINFEQSYEEDAVQLADKVLSGIDKNSKTYKIIIEITQSDNLKAGSPGVMQSMLRKKMELAGMTKNSEEWNLCKSVGMGFIDKFCGDVLSKKTLKNHFMSDSPKKREAINSLVKGNLNLTKRNVAMSRIASLLGQDKLLAKSETARLVENKEGGKQKTGNMMAAAKGKEFDELFSLNITESENAFGDMEKEKGAAVKKFSTADLKEKLGGGMYKDMVNLTLIDILCTQSDRHFRNMFYDEDNKGKINSVQGIDNDMAFGTLDSIQISKNNMTTDTFSGGTMNLRHIDKRMAERIISLKASDLERSMDGLIAPMEIEAMKSRLLEMQQMFRNDMKDENNAGKYLENDDQWEAAKNEELSKTQRSDFGDYYDSDYFHRLIGSSGRQGIRKRDEFAMLTSKESKAIDQRKKEKYEDYSKRRAITVENEWENTDKSKLLPAKSFLGRNRERRIIN